MSFACKCLCIYLASDISCPRFSVFCVVVVMPLVVVTLCDAFTQILQCCYTWAIARLWHLLANVLVSYHSCHVVEIHLDGLVQDNNVSGALQWRYCSIAINRLFEDNNISMHVSFMYSNLHTVTLTYFTTSITGYQCRSPSNDHWSHMPWRQ